ncbi:BMA_0021/BMA_0022 family TOMM bacteriocin [Paraburkholderia phenazinium]|jgi:ribosomally synthesized peptide (two-chain TOMM family)|uniref:Ribosomal natural product, two-chain TOMM family n=1 Tax=Paraburkholderia phenazinium TaxID=60549 RepID=A0A1G7S4Y1_9BURK|nr:BMA_0021/BMA_0022 family TOMM bacteriocin [Paraburkholderia phenazinium]SDG17240.1 ribosomal natural product, two-chain TOMM family [Paraburkholderia phenazinium]
MTENTSIPTYEQFLEYRAVIIKAIATAWHDKAFLKELEAHPVETLKERFGYDYPFKIALKVHSPSAKWTPEINGGWTTQKNNTFTLILPPAPAKKEQYALALASYNSNHIYLMDHHVRPGV